MSSPPVDEIAIEIAKLTLKEALAYLIAHGVKDFFGKGSERLKQVIRDKENEGKYAFVPNKAEANQLLNLSKDPTYREIQMIVPNYRYLDIIAN